MGADRLTAALMSFAAQSRAFARLVELLERLDGGRDDLLPVLTYHRVAHPDDPSGRYPGLVSATPAAFATQMRHLAGARRALSLGELLEVRAGRARLPRRAVMVTFDDAYRDFGKHAWPVLESLGAPVTLFVPTAYPDHPERRFWWDRLYRALTAASATVIETPLGALPLGGEGERRHALRRLRDHLKALPHAQAMAIVDDLTGDLQPPPEPDVLGWDELRDLAARGVALAAHARSHALLDRIPVAEARDELAGSLADLRREIGAAPPVFAYPGGAHDPAVIDMLRAEGVLIAFTTERGTNELRRAEWLRLRRINVGGRSTLPAIRAQLLPLARHLAPPGRRAGG